PCTVRRRPLLPRFPYTTLFRSPFISQRARASREITMRRPFASSAAFQTRRDPSAFGGTEAGFGGTAARASAIAARSRSAASSRSRALRLLLLLPLLAPTVLRSRGSPRWNGSEAHPAVRAAIRTTGRGTTLRIISACFAAGVSQSVPRAQHRDPVRDHGRVRTTRQA